MEDMVRCEDWCLAWGLPKLLNPGSEWENDHDYFTEGPLFTYIIYCCSVWAGPNKSVRYS